MGVDIFGFLVVVVVVVVVGVLSCTTLVVVCLFVGCCDWFLWLLSQEVLCVDRTWKNLWQGIFLGVFAKDLKSLMRIPNLGGILSLI